MDKTILSFHSATEEFINYAKCTTGTLIVIHKHHKAVSVVYLLLCYVILCHCMHVVHVQVNMHVGTCIVVLLKLKCILVWHKTF